jgi:adenosylcobinamide-GDP ribazoletransferase
MNPGAVLRGFVTDVVTAFQFMTRLPMPRVPFEPGSLARSVKFFPLVGCVVGMGAAGLHAVLIPHLGRAVAAWLIVLYLVLITGCFHEDALADVADSFGAWTRERRLEIMRDSRIGSYGAVAMMLSIAGRMLLLRDLPPEHFAAYVVVAQVLCRWSTLPLSYFLPRARSGNEQDAGQGARIAQLTSRSTLLLGSILSMIVAVVALQRAAIAPLVIVALLTAASGRFFLRRLGGVTGDCFGATNQVAEIAVYLCGVWTA